MRERISSSSGPGSASNGILMQWSSSSLYLGKSSLRGTNFPSTDLALPGSLVVRGVGAEADVFGTVAVVEGGLDGPGVHPPVDGVQYDAPVGLEVGDRTVNHPGGAVAHLEDVHEDYSFHAGVPCLDGSLNQINPAGAAEDMGSSVDVNANGLNEELLGELEEAAVG